MRYNLRQNKFRFFSIVLMLLVAVDCARAATVSLGWSPSSDTNVVGYNVYYGTASGDYTGELPAGDGSDVTISNLTVGTTYYFAATAYDAYGNESGFSAETAYTVPLAPGTLAPSQGLKPGDPMGLQIAVEGGHWYEVQASVDLQAWSTIYQTDVAPSNGVVQFSDTNSSSFPSRFYRLVLH
jgi:hypothetical protein